MNVQKLMKQMQQVQADAQKVQEKMASAEVEGSAGGGAVKVVLTGGYDIKSVSISPDALADVDHELLEDMVKAAFEDALGKIQEMTQEAMSSALGGMQIPGLT